MANAAAIRSELHALLIGIDRYGRDGRPALGLYPDLRGAVRDAERMERFLRDRAVPPERIRKLTAAVDRREPAPGSPTYETITEAFQQMRREARPGDRILIHFSGHGGRVATICPQVKGPDGIDEVLVPAEVADPQTRYLRDVELAFLLRRMVDDDLLVTLVFDCCHAGGTTRRVGVRGSGRIDRTERPGNSLVAPPEDLARTWRLLGGDRRRSLAAASGWLPEPRGYALLAACRAEEQAFEGRFDGRGRSGALTYWLLDAARRLGPDATCRQLHGRLVGQVRERFEGQTPQLEGDENRVFLGIGERETPPGVNVLQVDPEEDGVLLAAGEAQGVGRGARFALYPPAGREQGPIAVVRIVRAGAVESWAEVSERLASVPIEPGARACLLAPGDVVDDASQPAPQAHRARYDRLRKLDNPDPESHLRGRLRMELYRLPADFDPRETSPSTLLEIVATCERLGGTSEVRVGEWLCLLLENASPRPLCVVVLDLEPTREVSRIFPASGEAEILEPGAREPLPLAADLPPGWRAGTDVLKAFATLEPTSFRWLELPPVGERSRSAAWNEAGQDWTVAQVEVRLVRD